MNERLQHFLSAENITQAQFADTINVARASVSHILAGRNRPGYDFITGVMKHYPSLNIEWLLSGKGKMYKDAAQVPVRTELPDLFNAPSTLQEQDIPADETDTHDNIQATEDPGTSQQPPQMSVNQRKIAKILVFYDDNTFIELS